MPVAKGFLPTRKKENKVRPDFLDIFKNFSKMSQG